MKRISCCLLATFISVAAFSQKAWFVYLQTEGGQPFFVRMNEKTHSSSLSGYLILSKLKDSTYIFKAGFPQQKWPEQQFTIEIKGRDRGFLLKNFGDKGWGLFDLQTLSVQMADKDNSAKQALTEPRQVSAFTAVLSKAANDPSLLEKPVAIKQVEKPAEVQQTLVKEEVPVKKPDTLISAPVVSTEPANKEKPVVLKEIPVEKKETSNPDAVQMQALITKDSIEKINRAIADTTEKKQVLLSSVEGTPVILTEDKPVAKADTVINTSVIEQKQEVKAEPVAEYKRSRITKRSESSTSDGLGLVYIDEFTDGKKDTIRILIPNSKTLVLQSKDKPVEEKPVPAQPVEKKEVVTAPQKPAVSGNCSSVASENDLQKLRKKMAAERADDVMIDEAKKVFKVKCVSVKQLKGLSNLFQNDAAKFQFFEAAYSRVSDAANFASLQEELKNTYYINRFKAILK